MLGHLKSKLKASLDFPSPPAIAQQIIALARDPHTDISQVAATIGRDPALAAKLLRVANSALYSRQRKSTNLRQALIVLGLAGRNHACTRLLPRRHLYGFEERRRGLRALLAARHTERLGGQVFRRAAERKRGGRHFPRGAAAGHCNPRHRPRRPGLLSRTASERLPPRVSGYETARLGIDHAELGAWLLQYWRLPEPLCRAVAWSHAPPIDGRSTPTGMAACCVALGSECVEILLAPAAATGFAALAEHASEWLGIDAPVVVEVMENIVAEIPEIERLFDTKLLQPEAAERDPRASARSADGWQSAGLRAGRQFACRRSRTRSAHGALQDAQRRDGLTGLYNRGYLDLMLRREFQAATSGQLAVEPGVRRSRPLQGHQRRSWA